MMKGANDLYGFSTNGNNRITTMTTNKMSISPKLPVGERNLSELQNTILEAYVKP